MILYYQFRALLSSVFWLCCGRHLRLNENGFWMQALFAICHVVSYIIWDCCMRSGQWPAAVNCLTCGWRMAQRELISLIKFTWTISKQHPQQTSTTLTGQRFISSVCCHARGCERRGFISCLALDEIYVHVLSICRPHASWHPRKNDLATYHLVHSRPSQYRFNKNEY